jgi:integrase
MAKKRGNNEGSVYKRSDGLWAAQITLPDGKRKYKYAKTQKEANEWLLSQRQSVRSNTWVSDDTVTVGAFLEHYLVTVLPSTLRRSTLVSYTRIIRMHLKAALGEVRLSRLTPQLVQDFYANKLAEGQSPRSVQYMHAVLHKALDKAVRMDLVARNVSDFVDVPSVKRHTPVVWSLEQVKSFVEAAKTHRHYALFVLALSCGLRQGELLGLQVEDIEFATGHLNVRRALEVVSGQGLQLTQPKTQKSRRRIRIPRPALEVLKAHVTALGRKDGFLFVTTVGTPIRARDLVIQFKGILERAGLPDIRFHDLRHLCATLHLMAGTNPAVVAQILGHSTITLTLQTYSHVLAPVEDEAADRMGKLLTA